MHYYCRFQKFYIDNKQQNRTSHTSEIRFSFYLYKICGYSNLKRGYLRKGPLRGAVKSVLHEGLINHHEVCSIFHWVIIPEHFEPLNRILRASQNPWFCPQQITYWDNQAKSRWLCTIGTMALTLSDSWLCRARIITLRRWIYLIR